MILELKTEMKKEDIDQRLQNFFESKGYEVVYKDGSTGFAGQVFAVIAFLKYILMITILK